MLLAFPSFSRISAAFLFVGLALLFSGASPVVSVAGSAVLGALADAVHWLLSLEARMDQFHGRSLLMMLALFCWLAGVRVWCEAQLMELKRMQDNRPLAKAYRWPTRRRYYLWTRGAIVLFGLFICTSGLTEMFQAVYIGEVLPTVAPHASEFFWGVVCVSVALVLKKPYPAKLVTQFGLGQVQQAASRAAHYVEDGPSDYKSISTLDLPLLVFFLVEYRALALQSR